ncbi:MAG: hypothetical protein ABR590_11570 [Spirochaetia bacterium]
MKPFWKTAGWLSLLVAVVASGCAVYPQLLRGQAESEFLPDHGSTWLRLSTVVLPDVAHAEQLEHEIRTAFMIAAARAEIPERFGPVAAGADAAIPVAAGADAGAEVAIRLDRRPYTRGMRRHDILTLTLQLSHTNYGAVTVVTRQARESTPSFVVIQDMTEQALQGALKEFE